MVNNQLFMRLRLLSTQDTNQVHMFSSIIDTIGKSLDLSRVRVFLNNKKSNHTKSIATWGPERYQGVELDNEELKGVYHLLSQNVVIEKEKIEEISGPVWNRLNLDGAGPAIIYPIASSGIVWGFIAFAAESKSREFGVEDREVFDFAAKLIASSLDYQENQVASIQSCRSIFERLDQFVIVWYKNGEIIYGNQYICDLLEYTSRNLISHNINDITRNIFDTKSNSPMESIATEDDCNVSLDLVGNGRETISAEGQIMSMTWEHIHYSIGVFKKVSFHQDELMMFIKMFKNNPSLIALVSLPDLKLIDANISLEDKTGYGLEELKGKPLYRIPLFTESKDYYPVLEKIVEEREAKDIEIEVHCKNGSILEGLFSAEIISHKGREYVLMVLVDISKQKQIQALYGEERKRLNSIIEGTRLGTWEWNIQTGEIVINDRWANMLGYDLAELEPISIQTWTDLMHPDDFKRSEELLERHFKGEINFYDIECRLRRKNGSWLWVHDRGKVIDWDSQGNPLMMYGTHSDINKKKEFEKRINEISIRDPLTNIYNRRFIYEQLEKDLERYKRNNMLCSVAILDIDYFKGINDRFGHLAGDYILKEFTLLISENLRDYDLLGRYGGEEFIIIMYDSNRRDSATIIERILDITREKKFHYNGNEISFTFSAGIADISEFTQTDLTNEKIISLADQRLYAAKQSGRNKIIFD